MSNNRTQPEDFFDSVVDNAIDFLRQALDELETKPKYSIIHFCASIELFLKARLMLEHWSLISEEPQKANIIKFRTGNFRSVGIDETIIRIQNIANIRIPREAQLSFSELREHRNKMVHFFHPDYVDDPTQETIEGIVSEQTKAWFHLHRLLTREWKEEFEDHQDQVEDLHALVDRHKGYLKAKFESISADIEKGQARGITFSKCESCGFVAARETVISGNLYSSYCLVCEIRSNKKLVESCPNCARPIFIYDLGEAFCEDCDEMFPLSHFVEKYAPIEDLGEGLVSENRAYCPDCEYTEEESVVPFADGWLCLCCLNLHDSVGHCGWCDELVAGDLEDSYVAGCRVFCEGYVGHHADD